MRGGGEAENSEFEIRPLKYLKCRRASCVDRIQDRIGGGGGGGGSLRLARANSISDNQCQADGRRSDRVKIVQTVNQKSSPASSLSLLAENHGVGAFHV